MVHILFSIAPVFVLILLGHVLRRNGIPDIGFWNLNDKLVYWVLFPCLLFYKTSTLDLDIVNATPFLTTVVGGFVAAVAVSLVVGKLCHFENPAVSSILQGGARHNTFIALAVSERVFGLEGLAVAIISTSVLIPLTNVTIVTAMVTLHGESRGGGFFLPVLRDLGRNPLLVSVTLGVSWNLLGFGEVPVFHETINILGTAALPIMLLSVGANIRAEALRASGLPMIVSVAAKMIVFPGAILLLASMLGLSTLETQVALVFGAVPTAASAFTLARQLGGDAPLMASIIALQTALSFVTLPLTLGLATAYLL